MPGIGARLLRDGRDNVDNGDAGWCAARPANVHDVRRLLAQQGRQLLADICHNASATDAPIA